MDDYPVVGRCIICGRIVPGFRKHPPSGECEGDCPRCGRPLHLKNIGPYIFQNIVRLDEPEACAFMRSLETTAEIEACFRLEMVGKRRDAVLSAGIDRYCQIFDGPDPRSRIFRNGKTLDDIKLEWMKELDDPRMRNMYVSYMQAGLKNWSPEQAHRLIASRNRALAQINIEDKADEILRLKEIERQAKIERRNQEAAARC